MIFLQFLAESSPFLFNLVLLSPVIFLICGVVWRIVKPFCNKTKSSQPIPIISIIAVVIFVGLLITNNGLKMFSGNGLVFIAILFAIIFIPFLLMTKNEKKNQLKKYWQVEIGMSEEEMLFIMGDGYNRSLLSNNRTKYEWRINATSIGTYHNGVNYRSYSGVQKVDIYTKDGYVEEIRPYNV